jgi:hypothetical protein
MSQNSHDSHDSDGVDEASHATRLILPMPKRSVRHEQRSAAEVEPLQRDDREAPSSSTAAHSLASVTPAMIRARFKAIRATAALSLPTAASASTRRTDSPAAALLTDSTPASASESEVALLPLLRCFEDSDPGVFPGCRPSAALEFWCFERVLYTYHCVASHQLLWSRHDRARMFRCLMFGLQDIVEATCVGDQGEVGAAQ